MLFFFLQTITLTSLTTIFIAKFLTVFPSVAIKLKKKMLQVEILFLPQKCCLRLPFLAVILKSKEYAQSHEITDIKNNTRK